MGRHHVPGHWLGHCRRFIVTLDRAHLPTSLAHLPLIRFLCYSSTTGRGYCELHQSVRCAQLAKLLVRLVSVRPLPGSLTRDDAVEACNPTVRLGEWHENGQGCRTRARRETTETTGDAFRPSSAVD